MLIEILKCRFANQIFSTKFTYNHKYFGNLEIKMDQNDGETRQSDNPLFEHMKI